MDQWQQWLTALRSGDNVAVADFWTRFAAPLLRLADHNLQDRLRRRVDPEDVVQSALRTFLRRLQDGQFELNDGEQLWALLCAITLNKTRQQSRHHLRHKRRVDQEQYFGETDQASAGGVPQPVTSEPTPAEAAVLVDLVEQILDAVDDQEERAVFLAKLEHFTNDEIAERIGCSERTVRRLVKRLRSRLGAMLED